MVTLIGSESQLTGLRSLANGRREPAGGWLCTLPGSPAWLTPVSAWQTAGAIRLVLGCAHCPALSCGWRHTFACLGKFFGTGSQQAIGELPAQRFSLGTGARQ